MQSKAPSVDEFLGEQSESVRAELEQLRAMIRKIAPNAAECMAYGMPAYTRGVGGPVLCGFNAQKHYLAFYLCNEAAVNSVRERLPKLKLGKGCIRFRTLADAPLPVLADALRAALGS